MDALKIVIRKDALKFIEQTTEWYNNNLDRKAATNFANGIKATISTISRFPQIGILDERRSTVKYKYYSILSHPKYRVYYRFTKTTLYVVAIRATAMQECVSKK